MLSDLEALARTEPGTVVDVDLDVATDLSTELEGHPDNASVIIGAVLVLGVTLWLRRSRAVSDSYATVRARAEQRSKEMDQEAMVRRNETCCEP